MLLFVQRLLKPGGRRTSVTVGDLISIPLPLRPLHSPPYPPPNTKAGFAALLRSHSQSSSLKQTHALILTTGFSVKNSLLTQMLEILSASGEMDYARNLFDEMPKPRIFIWNTLIRGYARSNLFAEAVAVYQNMRELGVRPDNFTFPFVFKACAALLDRWAGMEIHGVVVKLGLHLNNIVGTELVLMYVKVSDSDFAEEVFENMGDHRDLIAWNAVISAYAQSGRADRALAHFRRMEFAGVEPDTITLASVLSSCAYLGSFEMGKKLHRRIKQGILPSNIFVENTLLDVYSKCGRMEEALKLFNEMPSRNVVSWSTMIGGFAINGDSNKALDLFFQMGGEGVEPNDVTLLAVLLACSHGGLVTQGKKLFCSLASPTVEHYAAMIDLIGRSGRLDEAYGVIQSMPIVPDAGVWGALLNACVIHRNRELGEVAADELVKLAPGTSSYLVILSNMYAALGRWDEVEKIREWMRSSRLKKVAGFSSVELDGEVHVFSEGSRVGSKIHQVLCELTIAVRGMGYSPETGGALHDVEEEEKSEALMGHSERIAIAFIVAYSEDKECPLRIMKNLRICGDCHEFSKFASMALGREIVMRDKSRFHHFRDGECSCRDFW
ncbi:Pentatricopeptide repeat-containing protein [Apostasia shenzhenica]|uniref:Pentatricopeptide repeat-containing protein n=1 Tax=Apostasia shenzhenica TaxID=1088818 RepID=A0A2I0B309_9ASPA|nr:Pentatricopeptide repeat-containing protein [Apostasia shenzhenica]